MVEKFDVSSGYIRVLLNFACAFCTMICYDTLDWARGVARGWKAFCYFYTQQG